MHENKLFLPGQYEVEVNQKHLDKGIGNCSQSCVNALALKDPKFYKLVGGGPVRQVEEHVVLEVKMQ